MKKQYEHLGRIIELRKIEDLTPYEIIYGSNSSYFDVERLKMQREWDLYLDRNEWLERSRELRMYYPEASVSIDIDESNIQEKYTLPLAEYKRLKEIEEKYNAIKKRTNKE